MTFKTIFAIAGVSIFITSSCNNNNSTESSTTDKDSTTASAVAIQTDSLTYTYDSKTFKGFVSYDKNKSGRRPGILVVHEWWGLNGYPRMRAEKLAALGYIAMAVDMYGNGDTAGNPEKAQELATPFYKDPSLAEKRLAAAMEQLKQFPQTDTSKMAAIGYCYGGYVVLNAAKLGIPLDGVVSFHGDLAGAPVNKDSIKAKILVLHGDADEFVNPEVPGFKKSMDSAGVDYTFKSYPDATHAFTNPDATANGEKFNMPIKYNAQADSASWEDMKSFFQKIF